MLRARQLAYLLFTSCFFGRHARYIELFSPYLGCSGKPYVSRAPTSPHILQENRSCRLNSSVSPSLHPSNVTAIEGYDDDTSAAVADVLSTFESAYSGLSDVHTTRQTAAGNPALNEAAQVLVVADFADKHFKKIATKFDSAAARLKDAIVDAERQLVQPLEGAAAAHPRARRHAQPGASWSAESRVTLLWAVGRPS